VVIHLHRDRPGLGGLYDYRLVRLDARAAYND
jgi:hypothetical protein